MQSIGKRLHRYLSLLVGDFAMNLCFNDPNYKAIKEKYFKPSVTDTTIISSYNR